MCGNFINPGNRGFLGGPIGQIGASILAAPLLGPEIGALTGFGAGTSGALAGAGVGALTGAHGGVSGALKGAALGGAGGFVSGGGLTEAFPETMGAIHSGLSDAGDFIGGIPGKIGTGISDAASSLGFGNSASTPGGPSSAATAAGGAGGLPSSISAPSGGVLSAGSVAAPAGVGGGAGDITFDPNSSLTSAATAAGGASPGTQGLKLGDPNTFSGFGSGPGGANIPGATEGFGSAFTPAAPTQSFGQKALSAIESPSALLSAGGLALSAAKGNQPLAGEPQLNSEASGLAAQGKDLGGYLQSGTLPAGLQQTLDQASEAAKATIRSQYASRGMSGSSAEQQELSAVDARAQAQGSQMALQLLQTGISETGMASGLYEQLMNNSLQQDKDLGASIAAFASAAGGGSGSGTTINVGH